MAITNAQQYKQLVNPPMNGKKRPGYRGDAAYGKDSGSAQARSIGQARGQTGPGRSNVAMGDGPASPKFRQSAPPGGQDPSVYGVTGKQYDPGAALAEATKVALEKPKGILNKIPSTIGIARKGINFLMKNQLEKNRIDYLKRNFPQYFDSEEDLEKLGKEDLVNLPANLQSLVDQDKLYTDQSLKMIQNLGKAEGVESFEDFMFNVKGSPGLKLAGNVGGLGTRSAVRDVDGNIIGYKFDEKRGGGDGMSDYERRLLELEQAFAAKPETPEVEEDEIINYRLMADGGRAAFGGGSDMGSVADSKGNVGPGTGGYQGGKLGGTGPKGPRGRGGPKGPPTNVGGNQKTPVVVNPLKNLQTHFDNNQKLKNAIALGLITNEEYNTLGGYDAKQTLGMGPIDTGLASLGYNVVQSIKGNQPFGEIFEDVARNVKGATNISPDLQAKYENIMQMADGGRAGLAGGGMPYEGGIMDLESSRQMYGLGKLVKKVTRGVKKIVKSPLGKAAIGAALFKFGPSFLAGAKMGFSGMEGPLQAQKFMKLARFGRTAGDFVRNNPFKVMGGISALSGLLTPEEEEEQKLYAGADIDDPNTIMNNPYNYINRRLVAEGGSIEKEPVAKKVMPLLDMDGKEKDYRETGGFVDMGRMEKADDVPARLSKNEFVFTADAVRNAGDGSVDKGAEVMYNMMKNLESGGDVSEDSQGLDGARKMFQTSQRLEEVL